MGRGTSERGGNTATERTDRKVGVQADKRTDRKADQKREKNRCGEEQMQRKGTEIRTLRERGDTEIQRKTCREANACGQTPERDRGRDAER